MTLAMDQTQRFVDGRWEAIVPVLEDFATIPNKSPAFDPDWVVHGHMERAVQLVRDWLEAEGVDGATVEVHRLAGCTPVLLVEVPPTDSGARGTVLLYGHIDKQPEMTGWRAGLDPWRAVLEGDRLYGRGVADDGYAAFAAMTAVDAVRQTGGRHARCLILIECSEESGSPDLPAHVDALATRIGQVDLVVCLDSGCGTYDRLWVTTSLRGLVGLDLRVDVLTEGVHSGASGFVPSSFRVLRALLSRIEDEETGRVLLPELQADVPEERARQAAVVGEIHAGTLLTSYPFAGGTQPMTTSPAEAVLARTWRAALSVTGLEGAPALVDAGNVLRPFTAAKLSMRTPPTCDVEAATTAMIAALTTDPPHHAEVRVSGIETGGGWDAPATAPWLAEATSAASVAAFGQPAAAEGIGGSIPFMAMLGERFPDAQFLVTGVLGPGSNAHGPNEFLHLPTARRLTACIAAVLAAHAERPDG